MPPKAAATKPAKKSAKPAKVKISTPKAKPDEGTPFELGGQTYTALMPKDFVWMELVAGQAAGASIPDRARAQSLFLRACLSPADRDRITERMLTRADVDPLRGMELLAAIDELAEMWRPLIEGEFKEAKSRAQAPGTDQE